MEENFPSQQDLNQSEQLDLFYRKPGWLLLSAAIADEVSETLRVASHSYKTSSAAAGPDEWRSAHNAMRVIRAEARRSSDRGICLRSPVAYGKSNRSTPRFGDFM